jgi:hypothetical protein
MDEMDGVVREDGTIVFAEFEEGDPRREIALEARAEAGAYVTAHKRWHHCKHGVDWFAVQLQFGRGLNGCELAQRFGIGDSTISTRKRDERWVRPMSERDRRRLSQFVWLGGLARGAGDDPDSREALKASSEWRLPDEVAAPKFKLLDPQGAPVAATFKQEIPDDIYYGPADPRREDRIEIRSKLHDLVARMERDIAEEEARENGEVAAAELAGVAGGSYEPEAAGEDVVSVGDPGADPA